MAQKDGHSAQGAVNLMDLLARVENDRELLRELVGMFKEDIPGLLQSLKQSVAREDMKTVELTSHALKGMLSGLCVIDAAETASRLERMGRDGKTLGLTNALSLVESQVAQPLPVLDAHAKEAQS